jgi:hypothetical protein
MIHARTHLEQATWPHTVHTRNAKKRRDGAVTMPPDDTYRDNTARRVLISRLSLLKVLGEYSYLRTVSNKKKSERIRTSPENVQQSKENPSANRR